MSGVFLVLVGFVFGVIASGVSRGLSARRALLRESTPPPPRAAAQLGGCPKCGAHHADVVVDVDQTPPLMGLRCATCAHFVRANPDGSMPRARPC